MDLLGLWSCKNDLVLLTADSYALRRDPEVLDLIYVYVYLPVMTKGHSHVELASYNRANAKTP